MSDQRSALLAACHAAPDDDVVRGAFADFLDEQAGGYSSHAELIRVQCHELYAVPCEQIAYPLDDMPDVGVDCLTYILAANDIHPAWCPQCKLRHRATQILAGWDDEQTRHRPHPHTGNGLTAFVVKTYDRGLLHTVRGPLAVLAGGVCEACGGRGRVARHLTFGEDTVPCAACGGRSPGVLRSLREVPVAVEVVDREPFESEGTWSWYPVGYEPGNHEASDLPVAVCSRLDGSDVTLSHRGRHVHYYRTREAAMSALSSALRSLACPAEVPA